MAAYNSEEVSFYVVAHADDWQIFMHPNVYNDLVASKSKVVFIITTAGDAGVNEIYWLAREEGCKSSIRFCLAAFAPLLEASSVRVFNHHNVTSWSANNTCCYFLRLPDGNINGDGFPRYANQSLSRLKSGRIDKITAVDNSTTYENWSDFYNTLQAIIHLESGGVANVQISYLNPDTSENPGDHTDHISTGQAVQDMAVTSSLKQALYMGYCLSNGQDYLLPKDLFWKAGMFAAYEKAVYDGSRYSTLNEGINIYLTWCLQKPRFITIVP